MISYLQIDGLTKSFGDLVLFEDITFGIVQGQKVGLIAKNGTGKTTLLNIIAGKEDYDSGAVVFRNDLRVGYLEQTPVYPEGLTVLQACFYSPNETVRLIAEYEEAMASDDHSNLQDILMRMDNLKAWDYEQRAKQILSQLKITNFDQKVEHLSGGQLKRVALANVLITDPELIILDEPTVGLDPIQIIEIRNLVKELGKRHTVIFSSHILSEVQTICDQILMIAHGRLAAFGAPDELESRLLTPNEITLTAEGTEEQVRALLDGIGAITGRSITAEEGGLVTARLKTGREASLHDVSRALFFAFAGAGVPLLEMALKKANLEDIFIELTEQSAEAPAAAEGEEGQA